MKFELLLLVALIGSFCTISHASTLVVPTEGDLAQVTGASVTTEATDRISVGDDALGVTDASAPAATEAAVTETEAPSAHSEVPVMETESPSVHTEAASEQTEATLPHTEAPEEEQETLGGVTESLAENTVEEDTVATEGTPKNAPEAGGEEEATESMLTGAADEPALKAEAGQVIEAERDEVEVEDSEGLSTGQVVGIVFGALVAVVIIIAVIVVVVRRMGQYSP